MKWTGNDSTLSSCSTWYSLDTVQMISCEATAAGRRCCKGWCCLPGGQRLILSIRVKVVTKETHLHSHKWVSSSKGKCISVQTWPGVKRFYLSSTESTMSVHSLRISLLLSSTVFYLLVQKSDNTHRLSGVPWNKSAYENEKGREWRSLRRAMCIGATRRWGEAGWLFLVFRLEKSPFACLIHLSLICRPLWIIFLQRRSCVFSCVDRRQAELRYESHYLCVCWHCMLALCVCLVCVYIFAWHIIHQLFHLIIK